ncbi:MAG TPA: PAS domain-containing sensor histidine kinase [Chromatiaceae bacterium]|jgi:PAS domain S-box-containing protein|nr:MAG: hypothetical protein N838_14740 [Thiohalocapsa sp. PB-PSB1]QQO53264.1 MAG: PAS domain S-box protein [Thiohalocapsa sp. PB-PSB1]HBG96798.1 PAS domain-containing sensor histidine kinase [Chromatiaceae bacterium]HCS91471.1 PAS domain-containing sensor histidine kinase [Chromatiaceae bacterium]
MTTSTETSPFGDDLYRTYFANANLGLAITSPTRGWLHVNARLCELLGYSRDELKCSSWPELTHPDDLAADEARFKQVLAGEIDGYALNKRFIRKDGSILYSHLTVACERDADGRVLVVLASISDRGQEEAAMEALRISEERFQLLAESTLDGLWDWDIIAGTLWLSPSWKAQLGWRDDELSNSFDTLERLLHAEDREQFVQHLRAFMQEPAGVWQDSFRLRHRDGTWRQIMTRGIAVIDTGNRLTRIFGVHIDITHEREAAAELRAMGRDLERILKQRTRALIESETRYRNIADYTTDWETWTDPEGNLSYCSPACEKITGHGADDFIADPELLSRLIHPNDRTKWREHVERIRTAKNAHQLQFRIIRPDGTRRWLEHGAQAIYAEDGSFAGIRGSTRDITDAQESRLALEREKTFIETVFNTAPAVILVLSPRAQVLRINRYIEQLSGWPVERILGQDWIATMLPESERAQARRRFKRALEGQRMLGEVYPILARDGELKYISWHGELFNDAAGEAPCVVLAGIDVSAQQTAELALKDSMERLEGKARERTAALESAQAALIQSEKLSSIGTLVAGLSHELNNPLMGIINYVQFAREQSTAEVASILAKAERELHRITTIVTNLLQFSRPREMVLGPVDLAEPMRLAVDLLAADLRGRKIRLDNHLPLTLPRALADASTLQQVYLNLLMNARDAVIVRQQRRITLHGGVQHNCVWVDIADNGPGIPAHLLSAIFDPFFTTKSMGQGTGLGLSVSKGIIIGFGGTLAVRDTGDHGTVFRITLAMANSDAPACEDLQASSPQL